MSYIETLRSLARRALQPTSSVRSAPAVGQSPGSIIGDAPVTISLSQLDEMRAQVRAANERASKLEGELAQARAADPSGRIDALHDLARDQLTIVRFAVANLPPMEIRKWPWATLEAVAMGLQYLPDFSEDDEVLRGELMAFAADVREHELDRSRKQAKAIEDAPPKLPPKRKLGGLSPMQTFVHPPPEEPTTYVVKICRNGLVVRELRLMQREIRFGSDPSNHVMLEGAGIEREHAHVLLQGSSGEIIAMAPGVRLRVNFVETQHTKFGPTDVITIGPYDITIEPQK